MADDFQVLGANDKALFSLVIHRGEGMVLLAMNWNKGQPPDNFVGFGLEYKEPDGNAFRPVTNRLCFPGSEKEPDEIRCSSLRSPIQKFRWVHFPHNAHKKGDFTYRVTPVFMDAKNELSSGESQTAKIALREETFPGQLNVAFTRGYVSSQAFIDKFGPASEFGKLIPAKAKNGLDFKARHPKAAEALAWMGFEAREAICALLDEAIKDSKAKVCAVGFDMNLPDVVERLQKMGKRARVIIDDSPDHSKKGAAENEAEKRLVKTAGRNNVKRQHMGKLEHNKMIVVTGMATPKAIGGSTNFSWRGFFVQSNNAVIVHGEQAVKPFLAAFKNYWDNNDVRGFAANPPSAKWTDLGFKDIDAKVTFSPHDKAAARLGGIAEDLTKTRSSLLFSLAFLYQTPGPIRTAIKRLSNQKDIFVFGISDKEVKKKGDAPGLDVKAPAGNQPVVFPTALIKKAVPEPFKSEATGGAGVKMHHKFLVIDFDKPTARVYMGSYNFSSAADLKNGENLMLFKDRKIATAYMVEAIRIFDHYQFRVAQQGAKTRQTKLALKFPPRKKGEKPWWDKYYTDQAYINDRKLFSRVSAAK
jgi:phosphatidylserine/phosphatidylglycerophosphate/cardiolipin synthase-like enzyme